MNYHGQRMTGVYIMSGTWKYRTSLVSLTQPIGLHRTFYQMIPEKKEEFFNTEDDAVFDSCFRKIVYHYNRWERSVSL